MGILLGSRHGVGSAAGQFAERDAALRQDPRFTALKERKQLRHLNLLLFRHTHPPAGAMAHSSAARMGFALLLLHAAAAGIVKTDGSDLCTSNLAACEQQCMTAGQYAFDCSQGGTFDRPSSTCKCVKVPPGVSDSSECAG